MHLNHPQTIPFPSRKNCLPRNWFLVPTRLGTVGCVRRFSLEQPDDPLTPWIRVTHTPQHPFPILQMISPIIRTKPQLSVAPASLPDSPCHPSPTATGFLLPLYLLNVLWSKVLHMLLPLSGKLALDLWFLGVSSTVHFSVSQSHPREDFPVQASSSSMTVNHGGRTGVEGKRQEKTGNANQRSWLQNVRCDLLHSTLLGWSKNSFRFFCTMWLKN